MDFLNKLFRLCSSFRKSKPSRTIAQSRRSPQIESLEAREMLAVSILSAPVTGHAAQDNPAEIRFDLTTSNGATTKLDFTVKQASGSTLDPSKLSLLDHSTGRSVALSNLVDGTASGSASAYLKTGTYSIIVGADAGKGNFTLDILQDQKSGGSIKNGLDILVAAAISQQEAGWSYRIAYFNTLLAGTDYAGAAGTKPIALMYPEVDVNGDGMVNVADLSLAEQLIIGSAPKATVTAISVVTQDLTGPSVTVGLKNDTGVSNDRITTDPTIVGRATDASGVKSIFYTFDGVTWALASTDTSGNYTISNKDLASGTHTITVCAYDTKGNFTCVSHTFTLSAPSGPGNLTGSAVTEGGSGTVRFPSNLTVQSVDNLSISAGKSVTLKNNKGTVSLASDGTLTFTPGSHFVKLAQGEKETLVLNVISRDAGGHQYTSTVSFTVTGKNDLPTLKDTIRPTLSVNEKSSGILSSSTLLGKWTDPDNNAALSIASTSLYSVSCSNSALSSIFSISALKQYISVTNSGVKLDATASVFSALGAGETLTLTVSYKVKDQYGISGDVGYLTFTVVGKNDNPVFTGGTWTVGGIVSNDRSAPVKKIEPGFSATDPDRKDASRLQYSYSNVRDGSTAAAAGLIRNFDARTGNFELDTSKLANRAAAGKITLLITVGTSDGGSVSKTLTINYAPEITEPAVPKITASTPENQSVSKSVSPTIRGNAGYTISNLRVVAETGFDKLPAGLDLNSIVSLGKNTDGSIGFTFKPGKNFEYLKAGETLKIKLQYTLTDSQYGSECLGIVELTINGAASSPVPPANGSNDEIGKGGRYDTTEDGGNAPAVKVPKDELLSDWTLPDGPANYAIVPGSVTFSAWSGNSTFASSRNPLGTTDFGTVNVDASGNLVFTPTSTIYTPLGEGQWIDLAVSFRISDGSGSTVPGGTVLLRINGSNDDPTLTWQKDAGFNFASNSKTPVSINAGFVKNDIDLNDDADALVYDLDQTSKDRGFAIGNDGVVTIGNGKLAALNGSYTVKVVLRDNHGGSTTKDITVNFFKEAGPVLNDVTLAVGEKASSVLKNLNDSITKKPGRDYSFSQSPTPTHYSTDGTTWHSISGSAYDVNGCWSFNSATGVFTFAPDGKFDALTDGDSFFFKFEYKVSDNGYNNCVSTGSLVVKVGGVNDLPTQPAGTPARTETVTESVSAPKRKIENLLSDWTDADHANSTLKISGLRITANGGSTLISLNALQAAAPGFLKIVDNGRSVEVDPSHEIFRRLGLNQNVTLTVGYTVTDPKGGTGTGMFTLKVNGSNDPPTLVFGDFVWKISETTTFADLDLTPYVVDYDAGDSHYILKIDGESVDAGWTKTFDDGATVRYLGGLTLRYELNGKFEYLSAGYSAFDELSITITDGLTTSSAAKLKVEVRGVHTPIRLDSDAVVTKTVDVNGLDAACHVDTIRVTKDSNDTLKYTVVCTASDGNTYNNLFAVDAAGKFYIDPAKIGTLNKNLTYTVVVTIENADFADTPLTVTYTLKFTHRDAPVITDQTLTVSQNDAEKALDLGATFKPADGYLHEIIAVTNGTEVAIVAGTDYTVENGVFKFLAGEKFKHLYGDENATLTFKYRITDTTQGDGSCFAEATLTVTVQGENDAPIFTAPELITALDSTAVEIPWKNFFSDVDKNDTLTLTGISGTAFDNDGKVVVVGVGMFELDDAGKLYFTPDAAFNSLKKDVLRDIPNITLNVKDSTELTVAGPISLQVKGTNKAPVITTAALPDQSVKQPVVVTAGDIATDVNGDALRFESIKIGGMELIDDGCWNADKNVWMLKLTTGTTITLGGDKTTLTIDGTTRNGFLPSGEFENFSLEIIVADEHDAVSGAATLTARLEGVPPTAPAVTNPTVSGITEDDVTAPNSVALDDSISDSNVPCRETDDWYAIAWNNTPTAKINGTALSGERLGEILASGFWQYENGVLTFDAPAGSFDFLAAGETLTLTFTYTVTDKTLKDESNGDLVSTGTVTVEIAGRNDDPVITGSHASTITHSGIASDSAIPVGNFQATDADDGDIPTLSVGTVTGTKNGEPLETCPVFTIDGAGNVAMTNSNLPELLPGESAVFTVQIVADDNFDGQTIKTITVTVYAKTLAKVDIDASKLDATEGNIDKSTSITVTDSADDFRAGTRSGNAWYNAPVIGTVTVPQEFSGKIPGPASFFKVIGDSTDGYRLSFVGEKSDFEFLRKGETLTFTVTVGVTDNTYGVTTTETVTVTVTGVGDAHAVDNYTGSFDYWANQREDRPTVFDPACTVTDPDRQSTHGYQLHGVAVDALPDGYTLEQLKALISVNAETGEITLDESGLAGLTIGFKYTLTIRVVDTTGVYADEHFIDVAVDLNVKLAGTPVVDPIAGTADENENVSKTISVKDPSDDADRDAAWYTISEPNLTDVVFDRSDLLPNGFDWNTILAGLGKIENGVFKFNPNSRLDFLPEGSTLVLTYEFTVTDTKFNVSTTQIITLTISGKNTKGTAVTDYVVDGVHEIGASEKHEVIVGDLADLVEDIDLGDAHTIVSIDGTAIGYNRWTEVAGKGEFYYYGGTRGADGLYYGGSLKYRPSAAAFETLRHGEALKLDFQFVLKDDSGALDGTATTTTGDFSITVQGTNKMPEVVSDLAYNVDEGQVLRIHIADIATDMNGDDSLRFYKVNGKTGDFRLSDGTTIRFDGGGLWIEIDTTTRDSKLNMLPGEDALLTLSIVVADNSGAENFFSMAKPVTVTVDGIDDLPEMSEKHEFGVGIEGLDDRDFVSVGHVDFRDADTDTSEYEFTIVNIGDNPGFALDEDDPTQIYFYYRPTKFTEGTYTFKVVATRTLEDGTKISCETLVTVTLSSKRAPTVKVDYPENGVKLPLSETDKTGGVGITVTDPNGEGTGQWYTIENVRYDGGSLAALPAEVEFGFENGRFVLKTNGAFDYLRAGEKATLSFEFAVRNVKYGIDTVETIKIEITGVNSSPVAEDYTAMLNVPADTKDGFKFYLSELASDSDAGDTLGFHEVNGKTIVKNGPAVKISVGENELGSVYYLSDDKGDYLLFFPNGYFKTLRYGETETGWFEYTVIDDSGDNATKVSDAATISFNVVGTNKNPVIHVKNVPTPETETLVLTADDIARDTNIGDSLRIVGVKYGGTEYWITDRDQAPIELTLASGATLTLNADGRLVYEPGTRTRNMSVGDSELEQFELIVADDSGDVSSTSLSGWTKMTIEVKGVNEAPTDRLPEKTEYVESLQEIEHELYIDLSEHFRDRDIDDTLRFSIKGEPATLGFLTAPPVIVDGHILVLRFMKRADYSNDFDLSAVNLTILVDDGNVAEPVEKTLTFRVAQQYTAELDVVATKTPSAAEPGGTGTKPAPESFEIAENGEYYIEVWASDLINSVIANGMSLGLESVAFSLYFNSSLCEILGYEYRGSLETNDIGLRISVDDLARGVGVDGNDLLLLRLKVKAVGEGGSAGFTIDPQSVAVKRHGEGGEVHASQVRAGSASVKHLVPVDRAFVPIILSYSEPSTAGALQTFAMLQGWTAEDELKVRRREENRIRKIADELLETIDFDTEELWSDFGSETRDDEDKLLDPDLENILAGFKLRSGV